MTLAPDLPETLYNLACVHAKLRHPGSALSYLARAIEVGGGRFRAMARIDADLADDPLRKRAHLVADEDDSIDVRVDDRWSKARV